jgi:hypothetical protein
MDKMWCWRCKEEVPMLDEAEYAEAHSIYGKCMNSVKAYRQQNNVKLDDSPIDELFKPVCDWYQEKTGVNCHHNSIMHHRISEYGEPCKDCGKPLRTPKAKFCAECGATI